MTEIRVVDPHTAAEVQAFAATLGITADQALWIDYLRKEWICQEYGYVKAPQKGPAIGAE